MTLVVQRFETKPVPYEAIRVTEENLEEIALHLGFDVIETTRHLNESKKHFDKHVLFAKTNGVRLQAKIGGYIVKNMNDVDGLEWAWVYMSESDLTKNMIQGTDTSPDRHIYPPYDH